MPRYARRRAPPRHQPAPRHALPQSRADATPPAFGHQRTPPPVDRCVPNLPPTLPIRTLFPARPLHTRTLLPARTLRSSPTHPPPSAHLLLALADVTAGDVVIDPMCGVGTLPVVGAAACAGAALCLGGDIEADCVAQARRLIQMSAHCAMRDSAVLCCVLITHSLRGVGASQRNRARRRGAALCRHELARAMPHRARIGHAVAHRAPALLDFGEFPRKSPRRAGGHV